MKLWAKLTDDFNAKWLPLNVHANDTEGVISLLWEQWVSESQKRVIQGGLSNNKIKETLKLLAYLHDIGKITPSFQARGSKNRVIKSELEQVYPGISTTNFDGKKSPHNLAGQYILKNKGFRDDITLIIGGHHGKPVDSLTEVSNQAAYLHNYYLDERLGSVYYKEWDKMHMLYIKKALGISGFTDICELPSIGIESQVLIEGLLIMSDWIASNEEYFPLLTMNEDEVTDQAERVTQGFNKWYRETKSEELIDGVTCQGVYQERFGFQPNKFQEMVWDTVEQVDEIGIMVLEAPMGLGKTEATLITSEQLEKKGGYSGFYFGLPTQATSNAIFSRLEYWLTKRGYKGSVRLSHSKSFLHEGYSQVGKNVDDDLHINEWFNGSKKSLLDNYVVGTIDSFLASALKQKHLFLRHLGLSKKVIILDEVHAYDTYMGQYLNRAVEWMGLYKVPVILVSATLPEDKKTELIQSYMRGRGVKKRDIVGLGELNHTKYPSLIYTDGVEVKQNYEELEDTKDITIKRVGYNQIYSTLNSWMGVDGVKGVIVNNVSRAQEIARYYRTHYPDVQVELLHSRFTDEDRAKIESRVMGSIGKGVVRPKNILVVGTQILEQSLDIDFDVLMTEIAPMDLLLQRVGRLHRHTNDRHTNWQVPTLYVIGDEDTLTVDDINGYIYTDYLIARTQHYLTASIKIPQDIPYLVGKVYNDEDPQELVGVVVYNQYKADYLALLEDKERRAKNNRLGGVSYRKGQTIEGWLKNELGSKADGKVRDIDESLEVILVKPEYLGLVSNAKTSEDIRKIHNQSIKLPQSIINGVGWDDLLDYLDEIKHEYLREWNNTGQLKGKYGIVLDNSKKVRIKNMLLQYTEKSGLEVTKGVKDESL